MSSYMRLASQYSHPLLVHFTRPTTPTPDAPLALTPPFSLGPTTITAPSKHTTINQTRIQTSHHRRSRSHSGLRRIDLSHERHSSPAGSFLGGIGAVGSATRRLAKTAHLHEVKSRRRQSSQQQHIEAPLAQTAPPTTTSLQHERHGARYRTSNPRAETGSSTSSSSSPTEHTLPALSRTSTPKRRRLQSRSKSSQHHLGSQPLDGDSDASDDALSNQWIDTSDVDGEELISPTHAPAYAHSAQGYRPVEPIVAH